MARPWFWRQLFLIQNSIKKYSKIDFSSFWQDFGFGGSFLSIQNSIRKVFKNWFFQLLARSWFWWHLFLYKIRLQSIQNLIFPAFWDDLGFGGSLFSIQNSTGKYSKIDFSRFWHDLGFGGILFYSKFNSKSIQNLVGSAQASEIFTAFYLEILELFAFMRLYTKEIWRFKLQKSYYHPISYLQTTHGDSWNGGLLSVLKDFSSIFCILRHCWPWRHICIEDDIYFKYICIHIYIYIHIVFSTAGGSNSWVFSPALGWRF